MSVAVSGVSWGATSSVCRPSQPLAAGLPGTLPAPGGRSLGLWLLEHMVLLLERPSWMPPPRAPRSCCVCLGPRSGLAL